MGCKRLHLPAKMRKSRIKRGLTPRKVSDYMGGPDVVSAAYVKGIMRGLQVANTELGRRVRAAVAELSKCTVQDIWPGMDV